ncbi:MAG: hypothetical protein IJQ16_08360 [Selenomonadaceae bacterium]|nr:hypothetical protein [Selenomonadaceae bacterium]
MWYNCDYRFYYVRKFFPDYDYYWQIEYDVFCNAKTYEGFLKKFSDNRADLLVNRFGDEIKNGTWCWTHGVDWIYNDQKIYKSIFPAVRLSAQAVDFLYKRRLEHAKIFNEDGGKNKWTFCEAYTPTELMNNGFSCENLDEEHVKVRNLYLNDNRFFLTPDDKLYHAVKPVKKEIDKLNTQVNDLNLLSRKIFLTALIKFLDAFNVKGLPHYIAPDFGYFALPVVTLGGGNLNCTTWHKFLERTLLYR